MSVSIGEMAVAWWRLGKWVSSCREERKMAAESALRRIGQYLTEQGIEIQDPAGQVYDPGLPVEPVGEIAGAGEDTDEWLDDFPAEQEKLYIIETIQPIVLRQGELLMFGRVALGTEPPRNGQEGRNG